jgi:predicted transposase YdaD
MNPEALAVLIPVVLFGGFFSWMIARTLSKAYTAKLQAGGQAGPAEGRQEELATTLEELRREVAELAERVDFTERLLARTREGEAGKLAPGDRRTGST